MIFLSSPLKYDLLGNMASIIFFHGIEIVTTKIVNSESLSRELLSTRTVLKNELKHTYTNRSRAIVM